MTRIHFSLLQYLNGGYPPLRNLRTQKKWEQVGPVLRGSGLSPPPLPLDGPAMPGQEPVAPHRARVMHHMTGIKPCSRMHF
jgi:hypothetical protein